MSEEKPTLNIRLEFDHDSDCWVAKTNRDVMRALGLPHIEAPDAGAARQYLVRMIEEHFPSKYQVKTELVLPTPELQARVKEFKANELRRKELDAWVKEHRIPLAMALIQARIPQKIIADDCLLVTETWLSIELKKNATGIGRKTGKTAKVVKTGKS
jgi:hypothetical protein